MSGILASMWTQVEKIRSDLPIVVFSVCGQWRPRPGSSTVEPRGQVVLQDHNFSPAGPLIKIDGKTRTDPKFPTGFMDVVQIDKTGENFRIIYDVKGRFTVHR